MNTTKIIVGDALQSMQQLGANSIHCCVTSPPYWALRSYLPDGHADKALEIGGGTLQQWVDSLVAVFEEVRRVLRPDGVLWVNCGDSYASNPASGGEKGATLMGSQHHRTPDGDKRRPDGLKPKDMCGQPWLLAFALQSAGWWLRSDCIWHKPNPMPESVTDRPTKAHEYVFMLTKSERYFFDAEAVKEAASAASAAIYNYEFTGTTGDSVNDRRTTPSGTRVFDGQRNIRTVWTIPSEPFTGAHFATFPSEIPRRCIKASTSEYGCCASCGAPWERVVERPSGFGSYNDHAHDNDQGMQQRALPGRKMNGTELAAFRAENPTKTTGWKPTCDCQGAGLGIQPCTVLDPFGGAGTTGLVANRLGRDAILLELNPAYAEMAAARINADQPMYFRAGVTRSKAAGAAQQKSTQPLQSGETAVKQHTPSKEHSARNLSGIGVPASSDQSSPRGGANHHG